MKSSLFKSPPIKWKMRKYSKTTKDCSVATNLDKCLQAFPYIYYHNIEIYFFFFTKNMQNDTLLQNLSVVPCNYFF